MTSAPSSMPRPIARCSTPMAASKAMPPRWRGCGTERRARDVAVERHRAEVERANREAEWLRHAVDELGRLAPQTGEETSLAERRTVMMQAEKVADDLRATHDAVSGPNSPVPPLATAVRRLERRAAQAPALDRAGGEGDRRRAYRAGRSARAARTRAARGANTIRTSWSGSRSACSRCAPPGANTMCRSMSSPRWRAATTAISP